MHLIQRISDTEIIASELAPVSQKTLMISNNKVMFLLNDHFMLHPFLHKFFL